MFRRFIKSLTPVRNNLIRGVGGGTGETTTAFERNSVTKEQQLSDTLRRSLPGITYISVQDISGGCGAMYEVSIEAKEFIGINTVKQHRLVTDALKSEIAEMHGIRIHTTPPSKEDKPEGHN